ncbi:MAG: flagellar hook-basal body complex protein FliE [Acidobacteriota bacterium]
MSVNSITQLNSISNLPSTEGVVKERTRPSFASVMSDAIEALDNTQKGAEQEIARTVAGESQDIHSTIATLQMADLNFQLAVQVRNKLIGAYEEIMRMQV